MHQTYNYFMHYDLNERHKNQRKTQQNKRITELTNGFMCDV